LRRKRYPRAFSLSILAAEEIGKISIIREIIVTDNLQRIQSLWKEMAKHTSKNKLFLLPDYILETKAARLGDFYDLFDPKNKLHQDTDRAKQMGFYSDCTGKCNWARPVDNIDEDLALNAIESVKLLLKASKGITSEAELAVWIKHLKPVWGSDEMAMNTGIRACYMEAANLGVLHKSVSLQSVLRFTSRQDDNSC
jgi:AbiV family abortive infection protein